MTTHRTTHTNQSELLKADVLIVTVTAVEADVVLEVFKQETGHTFQMQYVLPCMSFDKAVLPKTKRPNRAS